MADFSQCCHLAQSESLRNKTCKAISLLGNAYFGAILKWLHLTSVFRVIISLFDSYHSSIFEVVSGCVFESHFLDD